MIQWMFAIWSLVALPFLNPACTSESSWFPYCYTLAWRVLSITFTSMSLLPKVSWKLKCKSEVAQSCPTLCDPMDCSLPLLLCPWDFPGKSTGVGCHFLLQRIEPGSLPHCRQMLYHLSYQGGSDGKGLLPSKSRCPSSRWAWRTLFSFLSHPPLSNFLCNPTGILKAILPTLTLYPECFHLLLEPPFLRHGYAYLCNP